MSDGTWGDYLVVQLWSGYLFRVPEPARPETPVEYLDDVTGWQPSAAVWQSVRTLSPRVVGRYREPLARAS